MSSEREKENQSTTGGDRRRFLQLAKNLGIGAGVMSVALARPDYAVASGDPGPGKKKDHKKK